MLFFQARLLTKMYNSKKQASLSFFSNAINRNNITNILFIK